MSPVPESTPVLLLDWTASAASLAAELHDARDVLQTAREVGPAVLLSELFSRAPVRRADPRVLDFGITVEDPVTTLLAFVKITTVPQTRSRAPALETGPLRYDVLGGRLRPGDGASYTVTTVPHRLRLPALPPRVQRGEISTPWASDAITDLVKQINATAGPWLLHTVSPPIRDA